jgi:hypothetical protein
MSADLVRFGHPEQVPPRLDQVAYGATDLDAVSAVFDAEYQLTVAEGGAHPTTSSGIASATPRAGQA